MVFASETSQCRERLKHFCKGYGLDIGYGGDPIVPGAITLDLPRPYTTVGEAAQNLGGDARDLYWFVDNCLDYVFSSHLLEDFGTKETLSILTEWLRVLKPGGYLILYLPDEQKYRAHCRNTGQPYNQNHKIPYFGLDYVKSHLKHISGIRIIHENPACEQYSFEIVAQKILQTTLTQSRDEFDRPLFRRFPAILRSYLLIHLMDHGIKPSRFHTQNFYPDNLWTNGCGIIKNLSYRRRRKQQFLIVQTKGYHPHQGDLDKLNLSVVVNNSSLLFHHQENNSYYFVLDRNIDEISEIRIESSAFVPKELGINEDVRSLGIDVDLLRIE